MKAYAFDSEGFFIDAVPMQKDHLETKKQRKPVFLLPANSTTIVPPKLKDDELAKWDGKSWSKINKKKLEEKKQKEELPLDKDVLDRRDQIKNADEKRNLKRREAKLRFEALDIDTVSSVEDIKEVLKDIREFLFP